MICQKQDNKIGIHKKGKVNFKKTVTIHSEAGSILLTRSQKSQKLACINYKIIYFVKHRIFRWTICLLWAFLKISRN
jgi:hypothetical protein